MNIGRNKRSRAGKKFDEADDSRWHLLSSEVGDPVLERTLSPEKNCTTIENTRRRSNSFTGFASNSSVANTSEGEYCSVILATLSVSTKNCCPSPNLMRRRNAICDEIERKLFIDPYCGRNLRQNRVELLRCIALAEFSLL